MRMTVLFGSPRGAASNTGALLAPVLAAWRQAEHEAEVYTLYDLTIEGCRACRCCQADWERPACVIDDDMQPIFRSVLASDLVLLATPIYSWYCTAPVKAALDRLVYAMDKYYGAQGKGPSLLAGKAMAAVLMEPTDAVLFFSYSGSTLAMLDTLKSVRERFILII